MTKFWFGDWGVREILAHIAGWHWEMAAALERIAQVSALFPRASIYSDADSWNERFAGGIQNTDPDEVIEDLRASKEAFVAAASSCPEDHSQEGQDRLPHPPPTGIDHYPEHYTAIQEWRQREGI